MMVGGQTGRSIWISESGLHTPLHTDNPPPSPSLHETSSHQKDEGRDGERRQERQKRGGGERWRASPCQTIVLSSLFFFFLSPDSLRQEMQQIKQIKEGSKTEAAAADSKKDYFNICRERLSAAQGWCCDSSIIISSGVI